MDPIRNNRSLLTNATSGAGETGTIRIAVFDNNRIFRAGIVHLLNAEPDMEVVVEGGSALDLVELNAEHSPDVVILDADVAAAEKHLWQSIHRIYPTMNILGMAFNLDQERIQTTFSIGARGYILKEVDASELLEAVRALYRNEGYVSPAVGAMVLANNSPESRYKDAKASPLAQLSYREGQIFNLLAAGLKNREIGRRVGVTEKTIKHYVTRIFEKLHVRNRVEAAMLSKSGTKPDVAHNAGRVLGLPPIVGCRYEPQSPPLTAGLVAGSDGGLLQHRKNQATNGRRMN